MSRKPSAPNSWPTFAKTTRRDSHELMAEIFNSLDRGIEAKIME